MSALRTSMSSSLRVGVVGPAEVASPGDALDSGMSMLAGADVAATYALVLFVVAVIFLFVIL